MTDDAVFVIGGKLGVIACGWCAIDGHRKGVVGLPMLWVIKGVTRYSREHHPRHFRVLMALNLMGVAAFAWGIVDNVR
jgi:hypothetical protein